MLRTIIFTAILSIVSALLSEKLDPTNGKIVEVKGVTIEKFPFQVSVQIFGLYHSCGGAIISREWVLTNADCAEPHLEVRAGSKTPYSGGSMHQVVEYIVHENFTEEPLPRNNIALLRVSPLFEFDSTKQPIELHDDEKEIQDGTLATHSGFGINQSGRFSKNLIAITVQIVNRTSCSKDYEKSKYPGVSDDVICGKVPGGGKVACDEDEGGPLVVDGRLAGIFSYSFSCSLPEIPSTYTNVAHFSSWIKSHITKP